MVTMKLCGKTRLIFLISWFIYFISFISISYASKECNINNIFIVGCGENESCKQQEKTEKGICVCYPHYHYENGICVANPEPSPSATPHSEPVISKSGGSARFWMLIPTFILAVTGVAFLAIRRYKLVEKLYQFRVRRYNNVFVSSLQDDDAPIT